MLINLSEIAVLLERTKSRVSEVPINQPSKVGKMAAAFLFFFLEDNSYARVWFLTS